MNILGILLLIAAAAHGVPVDQLARVTILGRVYEVVLIKTIPKDPPLSIEFRPPRSTILFFKRQAFDIGPNFSKMIRNSNSVPNTKKIISNNFGNTLEIIQGNPVFRVRDTGKSWPVFVGEFNHRLKLCGEDDTSAAFVIGSTKGGAMSKVFAINTMEPHITEGRVIPEEHTDLGDHVSAMLVMSSGRILMSRAVHGVKKSFELIELRPVDPITTQIVQISGRNSDGLTGEELSTDEDEKRSIFEEKTMEMERDIMELHESDAKKMVDFLVEDNKRARLTLQHFQGFSDISTHDHVSEYTYCSQNIQSSIATLGQSFMSLFESNVLLEGLKQKSIENRCEKASKKLEAKIAQILEVGGYRSRKARSPREDGFRLVSVNEALYNQAVGTENFTCFAGEDLYRLQNQMDDIMNILQGNVD